MVSGPAMQFLGSVHDVHQLLQEPTVNLGKLMYLVHGIACTESLGDNEYTLIRRFAEGFVDVRNDKLLVLYKTMHALTYHTQALLNGFLKGTANGHDFTHRLHGRTQLLVYTMELTQVPARYLADYVVQCRLKES